MPKISLSVPHNLGEEEAKKRVIHLLSQTREQFGSMVSDVHESWTDNVGSLHFRAMGFAVAGEIRIEPSAVNIEINFPFAALPFKSRVEKEILHQAETLLA